MTSEFEEDTKSQIEAFKAKLRDELDGTSQKSDSLASDAKNEKPRKTPKAEKEGPSVAAKVGGWIVVAAQASWTWLKGLFAKIKGWFTSKSAEKPSTDDSAAPKRGSFSFAKHKTSIILGGVGVVLLGLVIFTFARFQVVTVAQGIETTLGASGERSVLIAKASEADRNDLVVAVLPGAGVDGKEVLIMGTVFSENDETYALYDGEVIWQIPLTDIRGMVMFAQATQVP
jgi:hypothetical protein